MRRLLTYLGFVLCFQSVGWSQSYIDSIHGGGLTFAYGPEKPLQPREGWWYLKEANDEEIWIFTRNAWKSIPLIDVHGPHLVGSFVEIRHSDMRALATTSGKLMVDKYFRLQHVGSIFVGFSMGLGDFVISEDGDTLANDGERMWDNRALNPQSVLGEEVYCMALGWRKNFDPMFPYKKYWGLLNTSGQWVILPKFDRYFSFVDGIAEVQWYGQTFKINEKGEWVE